MSARSGSEKLTRKSEMTECPVCGKVFSRGFSDLYRHCNAVSVQHLFAVTFRDSMKHECEKCALYFLSDDHLNMHTKTSWHAAGVTVAFDVIDGERKEPVSQNTIVHDIESTERTTTRSTMKGTEKKEVVPSILPPESVDRTTTRGNSKNASDTGSVADSSPEIEPTNTSMENSRTVECMICGKLFPRGPIDLHRHATGTRLYILYKYLVALCSNVLFSGYVEAFGV